MHDKRYKVVIILLTAILLLDYIGKYILIWLGLHLDRKWEWLLIEVVPSLSLLLIIVVFLIQHKLLKRLIESEKQYQFLREISPQSILIHQEGKIIYANPSALKALGANSTNELNGKSIFNLVHPDFKEKSYDRAKRLISGERLNSIVEAKIIGIDDNVKNAEWFSTLIQHKGKPSILVVGCDTTERKKLERELKESEEQYRKLVEYSPNGIAIHKFGEITYVNPSGIRIIGASSKDDLVGKNILDFIHPDFHGKINERWKTMRDDNKPVTFLDEKMIRLDKKIIDVEILGLPVTINGELMAEIYFRDITDRKQAEEHDPLTGLPNRRFFQDCLKISLDNSKENKNTFAVLFIDLDGFKEVNDSQGHDIGDLLLQIVAERLKTIVREQDTLSRLAGDEFIILLTEIFQEWDAITVAERVLESLKSPIIVDGNEVKITSSIGISFYPNGTNDENLLKQADMAMYTAKHKGKNTYHIYKEYH